MEHTCKDLEELWRHYCRSFRYSERVHVPHFIAAARKHWQPGHTSKGLLEKIHRTAQAAYRSDNERLA